MLSLKHLLGILWLISSVYCSGGGESTTFRKQDDHGNYKFGYDINDGKGGNNFHKESGDEYGNKRGSYGLMGPDGRMRIVHYIADEHGFRVDIKSNEPGLAQGKDSAAAIVNGKDADEHSDYSSTFGQRTPGYAPSPLYLSSTSNHPSSKPYYLSSYSKPDHSDTYSSTQDSYPSTQDSYSSTQDSYPSTHETYPSTHETYPPVHESYISKPKSYASFAAKSYYPKNLAYVPKYSYYPKPVAYEAPSYSSSYNSPSYGSTSSPYSYEPSHYPTPVHKATYSAHDDSYENYKPSYGTYGMRKASYHSPDLYGKSAEPVLAYTRLSGYSNKKHNEKTKYYNEPLEHLSSHPASTSAKATSSIYNSPISSSLVDSTATSVDSINTAEKKQEDKEVAASYRDEPKNGVISATSSKVPKLINGLIGLTSYRNPYSIDSVYKSS